MVEIVAQMDNFRIVYDAGIPGRSYAALLQSDQEGWWTLKIANGTCKQDAINQLYELISQRLTFRC